ncbi:MAG: hypothetical protein ACLQC7_05765 [Thermoplasmata archaeon]
MESIRAALAEAETALARNDDPRETIIHLYGQLLRHLSSRTGDMGAWTAEEIRRGHLERNGVRPTAALALTRLFETARYSTHPIRSEWAHRFGDAVRLARDDLIRGGVAG